MRGKIRLDYYGKKKAADGIFPDGPISMSFQNTHHTEYGLKDMRTFDFNIYFLERRYVGEEGGGGGGNS